MRIYLYISSCQMELRCPHAKSSVHQDVNEKSRYVTSVNTCRSKLPTFRMERQMNSEALYLTGRNDG